MKVYSKLVKQIRDAVSDEATIHIIKEGCIRILAYPCCELADQWLGGLSNFSSQPLPDIVDYEYAFPIVPGGSRIADAIGNNGTMCKEDCYGLSALKIAHCSHSQDTEGCLLSGIVGAAKYLVEENGYCPELGALCAKIKYNVVSMKNGELCIEKCDFCEIYVSVSSGGSSENDLRCAFMAVEVIENFFTDPELGCDIFKVITPEFPSE